MLCHSLMHYIIISLIVRHVEHNYKGVHVYEIYLQTCSFTRIWCILLQCTIKLTILYKTVSFHSFYQGRDCMPIFLFVPWLKKDDLPQCKQYARSAHAFVVLSDPCFLIDKIRDSDFEIPHLATSVWYCIDAASTFCSGS